MTTIVVDSEMGYMAADRMATDNDCGVTIECPKIKILELKDGIHMLGSSGMESSATIFEEWYESEDNEYCDPLEDIEPDDEFTTVILKPDFTIWVADKFYRPYQVHSRWYATGSGGPFAWAVLMAGCGIKPAMETAIKMDPNSGLGYDIEYLQDY